MDFTMDPRFIPLSKVKDEKTRFLWDGRVPLGAITILDGDPGVGKSAIIYDIAARLTRGSAMPGSDCTCLPPSNALLLEAEDSLAERMRPSLLAAGADMDRVFAYNRSEHILLPTDVQFLERMVIDQHAKLIAINPLASFLAGNPNSDKSVRAALSPLAHIAERHGLAVIIARHLTKSGGRNAMMRGAGSIGIIGVSRSALLIGRDPDDESPHSHVLALAKSNVSSAMSLRFRTVKMNDAIAISWLGPSNHSADDISKASTPDELSQLEEAKHVLFGILKSGPVPARDVIALGKKAGISERTLKRAKHEMRVKSRMIVQPRVQMSNGMIVRHRYWVWDLPAKGDYRRFHGRELDDLMDQLTDCESNDDSDSTNKQDPPHYDGFGLDDDAQDT